MLRLKALKQSLLHADGGQISHGLNLVLELREDSSMLMLLAKIRQAQRRINAGLGELNFVHYARFLPTYDNKALQVITEFDGPLAPYVLDFAIEIGDVFDMLLSHTEGTRHIVPIAEHAAEFLAFVEKHNTVTVKPVLEVSDWPLYAAYPEQTVLDITGPRCDLPIPKQDRWATAVEREDVQANVLQGYRAEGVKHFVLEIVDAPKARAWLADKATPGDVDNAPKLMSFKLWATGAKPPLMLNIGLTAAGMEALGIRKSWRAPFPEAFKQGALKRAKDNFDVGSNAPEHWWLGGPEQERNIHLMMSLHHAKGAQADFLKAVKATIDALPGAGLKLIADHDAAYNDGNSWFGYADGISNPRIAVACPVPDKDKDLQPAATAGEFVLGVGYKNIYGGNSLGALPAALATNGTFCAVRVLAQDTERFLATLKAEAARLQVCPDWLAAKLMGRWYRGAPLSLYPCGKDSSGDKRNDFDYAPSYEYPGTLMDHAGERCPAGAHIRRVNPRTARVAGARYARRLIRRGMHYSIKDAETQQPEVGLFGMFMCADLERQFEFIQRQWINGDRFAAGLRGTRDPFVGTPESEFQEFEIPMADCPPLRVRLPQFVRTRGSLYLFMPGLRALRQLDRFATDDPPVLRPEALASPAEPAAAGEMDAIVRVMRRLRWALKAKGVGPTEDELRQIALTSVGLSDDGPAERTVSPEDLRFEPRRRNFQIDPYPVFAAFRSSERVHYSPLYKGWFVFGYEDVVRVCTENDNFSAAKLNSKGPRGLFTLDEPEHAVVRQQVAGAWTKAAGNTSELVDRSIAKTLAAIETRRCFDLVDDFARPVPREVYFDILGGSGIGPGERLELDSLARLVMKHHDHTLDDIERWDGLVAGAELTVRLAWMLVKAHFFRRYPGSFLAHLGQVVDWGGGLLSPAVAVTTLVNLTVAGYMSVEFLLATGIRRLLMDGAAGWNTVRNDPSQLPLFLKEMLRTEHGLSVIDRFTKKEVFLDDDRVRIPPDQAIFAVLASANREERIYGPDADRFDPYRKSPPPHLGLGAGSHVCMGAVLQKSISDPAIRQLVAAMPDLRLQSAAQPPWFKNFYFRSFDNLPVTRVK